MEIPRILKEKAGEDDFYRLLNEFSTFHSVIALWSHTPKPTNHSDVFPLHYFGNDGWLAASRLVTTSTHTARSLSDLRKDVNGNKNYLFGFFSYDLKNELEDLTSRGKDYFEFPLFWFFEPELLLRFHNGRIECVNANTELFELCVRLLNQTESDDGTENGIPKLRDHLISSIVGQLKRINTGSHLGSAEDCSTPDTHFEPALSFDEYKRNVEIIRRHIAAGDVYELNYCMEWHAKLTKISPLAIWKAMNKRTHAPFSAFVRMNQHYLLSASPERFMCKHGTQIYSQPIKGTAPRHNNAITDAENARLLSENKKEKAENLMIVDLVRNDISRSCIAGSVEVPELCKVFPLQTVHQMCSTIRGELRPDIHSLDALLAAFPMGSMTGAPKISAMQLIDRIETFKRGIFSGSVGYFTPNGDFDFNVVIRSMMYRSDTQEAVVRAGSAITYDSVAEKEWEECLLKAKAIINVRNKQ